jgi:magnesium transporter
LTTFNIEHVLSRLRASLEANDLNQAVQTLEKLRTPDQAEIFEALPAGDQVALLPQMDPEQSADLLEELEDRDAAGLVRALPREAVTRIVEAMEPDEVADLMGEFEPEDVRELLTRLEDPEEIHPLLLHPQDSAGGLMTSQFLALRRRMTAREALQAVHAWKPQDDYLSFLFVVDKSGHLMGEVSLRQLIVANPQDELAGFMNPDVISVRAGTDQEEVARLMKRYDLLYLPVVDRENMLLGMITFDDVIDVLEDEATEDIQRLGGALPLDEPYLRMGTFAVTRKRIGWLMLLFLTESLTGTVLRHFQSELQTMVALSFFIPLLIGTGGNAGSQTTSTLIRALAVGDISISDALRAWWHELRVGLLLGLGMGAVAYGRALLWGSSPALAITIALAICTIVVWANALGAVLPLLASRLRIDPTVVSGPVMSTLVDATGLFIYFSIARIVLKL